MTLKWPRFLSFPHDEVTEATLNKSDEYAENLLKRQKVCEPAVILKWVPPTSNVCERRFSRSRFTQNHLRHALTPLHMEAIQFLYHNRDLWNAKTVSILINP